MKIEEIMNELENLNSELLEDISTHIENIKLKRKEDECFDIVDKLNELLKPLKDYADELETYENLVYGSEKMIYSLAYGGFVVRENFQGKTYIDWEE